MDTNELQKQIDTLKKQNKELSGQLAAVKIESAIKLESFKAGADPDIVALLIGKEGELLSTGEVLVNGLKPSEAITDLMKEKPYLVGSGNPTHAENKSGSRSVAADEVFSSNPIERLSYARKGGN